MRLKLWVLFFGLFLFIKPVLADEQPLFFRPVPEKPFLISNNFYLDTADYNTLSLKLKADHSGTARLFWAISYDPQFNEPKSIWFYVKSGEHNYYFNIPSQNTNWLGWANSFLVMPDGPISLSVLEAKLTGGGFFSSIASGWQEFWGPKGRSPIGSTVNLIPSSALFGKSINIYFYWIIILSFILLFIWQMIAENKKGQDINQRLKKAWSESTRKSLLVALISWSLLALNADYNYLNLFKVNYSQFAWKSLAAKRAEVYGQDFYNYLVWAQKTLPGAPVEFNLLSDKPMSDLFARIYLFPHYLKGNETPASYQLVYLYSKESTIDHKLYRASAQFKPGEYIMEKIQP